MNRRTFIGCSTLLSTGCTKSSISKGQDSPWSTAASIPINTQELYPAVHQEQLYVAGGIASRLGTPYFTNRFFSYNPSSDSWADETSLPEDLHHAALVSTGEQLFLVGGFHGEYSKVWQMRDTVYEYVDKTWVTRTNLPKPQAEGVLSAIDGDIHLVTGQSPKGEANSNRNHHREVTTHLVWQPGAPRWESVAPIPLACNSATGGWVGNELVVTGGRNASGNFDNTQIYNKQEDSWREAAPLPLPQAGTASVTVEDGIIVFGGEIFVPKAGVFKNVWRYNLAEDAWTSLPHLKTPRHGLGAGKIGNRVFVIGGATKPGGSGTSNVNEVLGV